MAKYSDLLKDPRWQKKRLLILDRDFWTCQSCMDSQSPLNVHHIKYFGSPWDCPDKFLVTLCEKCHELEEQRKNCDWYSLISESGITRKDFTILIEHINYYMSYCDPRDVGSFTDILRKIIPDADINGLMEYRRTMV